MRLPFTLPVPLTPLQIAIVSAALVGLLLLVLLIWVIRRSKRAKARRRELTEAALAPGKPSQASAPPAPPSAPAIELDHSPFTPAASTDAPASGSRDNEPGSADPRPAHIERSPTAPIPRPERRVALSASGIAAGDRAENGLTGDASAPASPSSTPSSTPSATPSSSLTSTAASTQSGTAAKAEAEAASEDVANRTENQPAAPGGDHKDQLLRVLLTDPDRALGAAQDLVACRGQLDRLTESVEEQRRQLADAARRLRRAGLTPAQVAQLAGMGEGELATLLAKRTPSPEPRTSQENGHYTAERAEASSEPAAE